MADYVSPFKQQKEQTNAKYAPFLSGAASTSEGYVSPFKGSRFTLEYVKQQKQIEKFNSLADKYKRIGSLPKNEQLDTVKQLRENNFIDDTQKSELEKAINFASQRVETKKANLPFSATPVQQPVQPITNLEATMRSNYLQNSGYKLPTLQTPVQNQQSKEQLTYQIASNIERMALPPKQKEYLRGLGNKAIETGDVRSYNAALENLKPVSKITEDITNFMFNPAIYAAGYNSLNENDQRSIKNNLKNVVRDYSKSSDRELRTIADKSAYMLMILDTSKEDLKKEGVDTRLGINLDDIPDIENKTSPIGFAKDFAGGTLQQFSDFLNVMTESTRNLPWNIKKGSQYDDAWNDYKSGKITKEEWEVRNARIDEWFDRAIGQDTSFKNRLMKAAGWGFFGASFAIPGGAFLKGGKFILKELVGDVVANGILGGLSSLKDYSKDRPVTWKVIGTNAALSALMSTTPYIYRGAGNAVRLYKAGKLNASPSAAALLEKVDNAATHQAAGVETIKAFADEPNIAAREEAMALIRDTMSEDEYTAMRAQVEEYVKNAQEVNEKIGKDIGIKPVEAPVTTATTEVAPAAELSPAAITQVEEAVTTATKETPAELLAKKQLTITNTMKKEGDNFVFTVTDKSGKPVATIKEVDMPSAQARLQQIKENPAKYSKTFKNLFEEAPKLKEQAKGAVKAAQVKEPARPSFLKEGQVVAYVTDANGKDVAYLRDATGKDVRQLTAAEVTQAKAYAKKRVEYFKLQEDAKKLQATQVRAASDKAEAARPVIEVKATPVKKEAPVKPKKTEAQLTKEAITRSMDNLRALEKKYPNAKGIVAEVEKATKNMTPAQKIDYLDKATGKLLRAGVTPLGQVKVKAVSAKEIPPTTKPKNVTKAVEAGAKEMDKLKEAPAKPLTTVTPGRPNLQVTKGSLRNIVNGIERGFIERADDTEVGRFMSEKGNLSKYAQKYEKDWAENPNKVLDIVSGKRPEEGKFQQIAYTKILESISQKGSAEDWLKIRAQVDLAGAPVQKLASETGQLMSVFSYFSNKYDINDVIRGIEKERIKIAEEIYKKKGYKLKDEIKLSRADIEKNLKDVKEADFITMLRDSGVKKESPIIKAVLDGSLDIKKMTRATSAERLTMLENIVEPDLAAKFAAQFEQKLLLKNQKAAILNWIKTAKNVNPAIKADLVTKVVRLKEALDPANKGGFDNFINTKLGIRLRDDQAAAVFNLQKELTTAKDSVIRKYGSEEARKKAAAQTSLFKSRSWQPTKEDEAYGIAAAKLNIYLKDVAASHWQDTIDELKSFTLGKVNKDIVFKLNDLTRGLQSALDNSFAGRQGAQVMKTNPGIWLRGAKDSYEMLARAMKDPKKAEILFTSRILGDPWAEEAARNGLAIMDANDIFNSSFLDKTEFTVKGKTFQNLAVRPYKASSLAYDTAAQVMRLELYKKFYLQDMARLSRLKGKAEERYGKGAKATEFGMPEDYPKNLTKYINSLTGRGDISKLGKSGKYYSLAFYSPSFIKSQFDKIVQPFGVGIGGTTYKTQGLTRWNPVQRRAAINLFKTAAYTAGLMGVANALKPGSAELDPRSADFGKIKIGNTRFDVTGGLGSFLTLGVRVVPAFWGQGYVKNSNTGVLNQLNLMEFGAKTADEVTYEFFMNKLAPVSRQVFNKLRGQDLNRRQPKADEIARDLVTPLVFANFKELMADPNSASKFWSAVMDFNGISANTYAASGSGSKGTSWDTSTAKDVNALKAKIGEDKFKEAGKMFDDMKNSAILKLRETPKYKEGNSEFKENTIRLLEAEIKDRVFNAYNFGYKAEKMSELERQQYKNLINQSL